MVPVYKGKVDPLECGSCQAIKLLEQAMKVVENLSEFLHTGSWWGG